MRTARSALYRYRGVSGSTSRTPGLGVAAAVGDSVTSHRLCHVKIGYKDAGEPFGHRLVAVGVFVVGVGRRRFVSAVWDGCGVTAKKLREWRGVRQVASPCGVAITARLRTGYADEAVLDAVADHVGRLRRADLKAVCRPQPLAANLDEASRRQTRRDQLNNRKAALTAHSSARWANAIIAVNNDRYRLARDTQSRHIIGLRAAIATIEKRLAQPTTDALTSEQRVHHRKAKGPRGYPTQAERFAKQRRLQVLRARLVRVSADFDARRVHVVEGGKRLAKIRHNLEAAELSEARWRRKWDCARSHIAAIGSSDEPFGDLTITVTPNGEVSLRLPKPLECLANAKRGRYVLSSKAVFSYRGDEWIARITSGQSMSYAITRKPNRAGCYLIASWATPPNPSGTAPGASDADVLAEGPVVGVDLNDGHLALRRLDGRGNPVGRPHAINMDLSGRSTRVDAQVRHAITRLIHYTRQHHITAIAVENLDFAEARTIGRETMGRGQRGKRFRKTVSGIPTAVFRNRLSAQAHRHGISLFAVNPAYTSAWGDQHWRPQYENVTRHQAAATVTGRRAQGYKARRRKGVTCTRPGDRGVRATDQAAPENQQATSSRHRPGHGEPNPAHPTGQEHG
jgi:IS605 OrfB family transposase